MKHLNLTLKILNFQDKSMLTNINKFKTELDTQQPAVCPSTSIKEFDFDFVNLYTSPGL